MPSVLEGRVVASFRAVGGPGRAFLERVRSLMARLAPLGAVHVGWDVLKATFAFDASKFPALLEIATTLGVDTQGEEPLWAVGVAQGDIRTVEAEGSELLASGLLWSGPPIVAASALAALARPGEILCAQTVPALRAGELVTSGLRIARDGTLRVRGARIDRRQPWRRTAAENLTRMMQPRLVRGHFPDVTVAPGALVVVRADPGVGGTRLLGEIASRSARALVVAPVGSGFEPLGALRRAFGREIGRELNPHLLELAGPLESLLAGKGAGLDTAARLVTALLWPKQSGAISALVIDDAKAVDPATLEACVRAVRQSASLGVVARLDGASSIPSVLAALPKAAEHELSPVSREGAEDIAVGVTGGALDALARGRWARLGGGNPLAVVEAVTLGIATGDIAWSGERASPRSRAAGRGEVKTAAKWIRQRANAERAPARALLSLLAVVGGEAKVGFLSRVLEAAGLRMDVVGTITQLERARWLIAEEPESGGERSVAFPARTHHKALFNTLEDDARKKLHLAISRVIEQEEGAFGRVEGAWHAAQAGEGSRASAALLEGARAASEARFEASCTQLIAFARRADPSCEEAALELLADALERAPSVAPVSLPPATTPSAPPSARAAPRSVPPSTAHASIPASRPSVPPRTGPARIAAIASVPPARHKASVAPPVAGPRPSSAPSVAGSRRSSAPSVAGSRRSSAPPPARMDAASPSDPDEPDSMVERALIVPPRAPDSMVERALFVAPEAREPASPSGDRDVDAFHAADSEPPTMANDELAPASDSLPLETTLESELREHAEEARAEARSGAAARADGGSASAPPPPSAPGSQIARRLGELAKEALLAADNAALERWVDGPRAPGEDPAFTERMRAMARLGRGDIGDALRVLRRSRAELDPTDHRRRCQASLALGVALSGAGRPEEALLEAMDALARARQIADERGAKACLAFLAKLYTSVSREAEAELLRDGSA
ncbi:MAG: hypothetical protein KF850_09655 [Labilithrix sp.]|nr:hypothetical protein [Labilithrix sp.]